jgi:hypothetical protein
MTPDATLQVWLITWLIAAAYILVRHWRTGRGAGLMFAYVFSFGAIHWLAAAIYIIPWYNSAALDLTVLGLRMATIGLIAFGAGGEIGAVLFRRRGDFVREDEVGVAADPRVVNLYIAAGVAFYGVVSPILSALPTVSALVSTASSLMVIGVALKAWNGWQAGMPGRSWLWLGASVIFPFVTLVGQGFLGFGFAAMLIVAAFVASFYRPRWQVVVVGVLVAYAGLSVYVTYMRDRRDIRAVVWGGDAMGSRVNRLAETFTQMEWFSPNDIEHLRRVDDRLNQDALVGAAVDNITSGVVPLAHGQTITDAVLALIPRALWPSKPIVAGSGDLVADYTGLVVAEGTSVGIGHVMESYINFGTPGVIVIFVLLGGVIVFVDRAASAALHRGDVAQFALWFLPGLNLLQVGGSFAELTSSAAAGVVIALAFGRITARFTRPEVSTPPTEAPARTA